MPSSIIRNPAGPEDDDFKTKQKVELDRLRTAIAIVERMRQAGISCELFNDPKTATTASSAGQMKAITPCPLVWADAGSYCFCTAKL